MMKKRPGPKPKTPHARTKKPMFRVLVDADLRQGKRTLTTLRGQQKRFLEQGDVKRLQDSLGASRQHVEQLIDRINRALKEGLDAKQTPAAQESMNFLKKEKAWLEREKESLNRKIKSLSE